MIFTTEEITLLKIENVGLFLNSHTGDCMNTQQLITKRQVEHNWLVESLDVVVSIKYCNKLAQMNTSNLNKIYLFLNWYR